MSVNPILHSCSYGRLGELRSVVKPDGTVIRYYHNANNQRSAKEVNGTITEKYLWKDLTTLLAVYNADDTLRTRFEYADGRVPYKMTYEGETYYLAYDQVGTLRAVTDSSGSVVKEMVYDTFGNLLSDSNPAVKVPFGFAGGLYDPDTGLTRFGYRDYDAQTGKWTAKDPIGFDGGDTNLYGYVLGDPVNGFDPLGLYDDPRLNGTLPNWNNPVISPNSIAGRIGTGLSNANIPNLLFNVFPQQGYRAYQNAHPAAQFCVDISLTIFEFGVTGPMTPALALAYNYYSGYNFNTIPTSPVGWVGWIYSNIIGNQ